MNPINFPNLITPVTATTPSHLTTTPVTTTALITSLSRRCHSPVIDPPLPSPLVIHNLQKMGSIDPREFVDDMDFASDIPTDGPATVEMVNATKDNFNEDDLVKFQELLLDAEKPLYEGCPDFTTLSAIVKLLNLKGYKKIHVCINNCLLYWKDDKDLTACQTCGISRWKVDNKTHKVYENIPAKVMWYFPIIPRLQRLFKIRSISEDLRWHATRRITDGVLRHLADSQAWRTIDEKFPKIAEDPRNLRLGISADGVDVNTGNRHHSVWPVLTVIYNLPPWLWVDTYDASIKDNFNLHAVVLWKINDYPALGTLCGCPYNGFKGCVKKKAFNGQQEFLLAPNLMTREQIYNEVQHIENKWGKGKQTNNKALENQEDTRGGGGKIQKKKRNTTEEEGSSSQVNRQNEKNVVKSLVGTFLNVSGKTKDGVNARLDLAELGVKPELFAMQKKDKTTLPPAGYTLTNAEKDIFYESLYNIRVPQGYCSNFSSLVSLKDRKLIGLKSHDYHKLMQEFLPIAIRSIMHPTIQYAIIMFFFFFKSICSKEIRLQELDKMQAELVVTLCLLEKFFPLSFFDIMVHLTVHLTREVKLCGPIYFQWMYPFERCIKVIKGHVRNKNRPEGCIDEETIAKETIEFFSEYHKSMETFGIPPDNHETDENEEGKPLSVGKCKRIAFLENEHSKSFAKWLREEAERELAIDKESVSKTVSGVSVKAIDLHISKEVATTRQAYYYGVLQEIWVATHSSDSYSTSQISTSEEIDYDSPEPPKSLLKWYHYLSDEYKDNGRFWGSKSGCNESDVKPSWKDIEKAKACMLAKAQASKASSKAKV
ncbi:putative transposase-associated domain-containing protein [Tanacetum coccineum]